MSMLRVPATWSGGVSAAFVEALVDLALRQPAPTDHDAGNLRCIADVLQRTGVEQHEIGALARVDDARSVEDVVMRGDASRPCDERLVRRQTGGDVGCNLTMDREARDVPDLRSVRAKQEAGAAVVQGFD